MNPRIITISVLIIASALIGLFLTYPKFGEVSDVRGAISIHETLLNKIAGRIEKTKTAIEKFQGLGNEDLKIVEKALPDKVSKPNILVNLDEVLSSAGLIVQKISISEAKAAINEVQQNENIGELEITLSARGGYESLKAFLKDIETNLRIFDVSEISFASHGESREEGAQIFTFLITLNTYYSK